MDLLQQVTLSDDKDRIHWLNSTTEFTVKSCSKLINDAKGNHLFPASNRYDSHLVWNELCSPRVCFFVWLVSKSRILTDDRMQKMGFQLASACSLCGMCRESTTHLMWKCDFSNAIWRHFYNNAGITYQEQNDLWGLLSVHHKHKFNNRGNTIWNLILHEVMWGLWLERNRRIFEGKGRNMSLVITDIKGAIWSRLMGNKDFRENNLDQIISNWSSFFF